MEETFTIPANSGWEESRLLKTVLGRHLLVKLNGTWRHLNPDTLEQIPYPDKEALTLLLHDAFSMNPDRYGEVSTIDETVITTNTEVYITMDWNTLSFTQDGWDSRAINKVYEIHYLEWTGFYYIDKVLGLSGLFLLIYMTWTGMQMSFGWDKSRQERKEKPRAESLGEVPIA